MTDEQRIPVRMTVDGQVFEGTAGQGEIVHEVFPRLLPEHLVAGRRLTFRTPAGTEVFADNFVRDLARRDGAVELVTRSEPIAAAAGAWRNLGLDHVAITVADRRDARNFFAEVLQMKVVRDDAHLTVLATGMTGLFLFDAGIEAPLSDPVPSRVHHVGFVVDDLAAAFAHIQQHRDRFDSDFALLERDERWSLYGHYRNGEVTFVVQLSEIKAAERGLAEEHSVDDALYDYARRPYGLVFGND
ncbi:MAG TPA: VOC family protein [Thermomicrobiales bacterium]|nr:VOC family protein [Thermomicrobiales bacterium]